MLDRYYKARDALNLELTDASGRPDSDVDDSHRRLHGRGRAVRDQLDVLIPGRDLLGASLRVFGRREENRQAVDEGGLRWIDLHARGLESNHVTAVDLGNVSHFPDPRGHSVLVVLLTIVDGSASPSHAHACTVLPAFCLTEPSDAYGPVATMPVSSSKLSPSGVEKLFAFVDDAFRDRPRAVVALCPERAARVGEKDLEPRSRVRR